MSLTRFAVGHRPFTWVLLISLLALGTLAVFTLSRREDPDLQGRFVQVIALYPGASTSQVELLVTEPVGRALLQIDNTKVVNSTSRPGIAVFKVECADRLHEVQQFRVDVRNRMADLRPQLPQGLLSLEVNDRFVDTAAMILGITWPGATDRQRDDIARLAQGRLIRIKDASEVKLLGEQQERIDVALSAQRMARLAVSPTMAAEAIRRRNVLPMTGGSAPAGDTRLPIEPSGGLTSEGELPNLLVASPGGQPVYLRDIATISRAYADPPPLLMRVDGKRAVGISISMRSGRNVTELGIEVHRELGSLRSGLPAGAAITVVNDLPLSVEGRMGEFTTNMVSGIALIFVTMFLFMGLRSALIVGVMLPITILGTFAGMFVFGRDIQQISIVSLIIALGLVVDNSIVVVDNIERKMSEGVNRLQAAVEGTDELRIPLLTSNLTTVASFAPMLLLPGSTGEFVKDLGIVTSLATLISLLLNYTVAPLIALRFLNPAHPGGPGGGLLLRGMDWLRETLAGLAARGLRHARITVLLAFAGLIIAGLAVPGLGIQFFPSAVRNQFTIDIWLPEGRDIRATSAAAAQVERLLQGEPAVRSFVTYVGGSGPRFYYNVSPEPPAANYAQIVVNTENAGDTARLVQSVNARTNATMTEARVIARKLEQGPPVGAPIAIRVSGETTADIRLVGEQIKTLLRNTPGTLLAYHDYGEFSLSLKLNVDGDRAALAGLSSQDIASATRMGFSGQVVTLLREGDRQIPVEMRLVPAERSGSQAMEDLPIPTASETVVPLRSVASVSLVPEENRIVRRDDQRTLTVLAFPDANHLASKVLEDARLKIDKLVLPKGVQINYGGEAEEVTQSFGDLLLVLGVSIAANLLVVVWEFNSFRTAFTILAAVPLSMVGAVIGLYLSRQPFGFMAFLGIISLGGIATNHAIVLFEYARQEQLRGLALEDALVTAGRKRLRPILLTVLLSIGGLLPQAVNGGSLWPPMAWSMIGGLVMSLVLTLVIVPSVYKGMGRGN